MALLFHELCEKLQRLDEVTLLELLNLSSEDLVDQFWDVIEDKQELLRAYFAEENGED